MAGECIMLGILFILAWEDIKSRQLPLFWLVILGVCGLAVQWWKGSLQWENIFGGTLIGTAVLIGSLVSRERIGIGDGILFCATGLFLGFWENLVLLFFSSLCASAGAVCLMLTKKYSWDRKIPFVPFVLTGDVCLLFMTAGYVEAF